MTAGVSRLVATLLVLLVPSADARAYRLRAQAGTLILMSFNIRYGTARDGENHWSARRNLLFDVVRDENADLIGLQEALDFQIDEILAAVPGYAAIGVGRDDAMRAGEYSAILFRKERFRVAESGTFWFSDTPTVPGSRSWGNNVTRICTWARLVDRDGRGFWHFNVHLDHESQPSRERSTKLAGEKIDYVLVEPGTEVLRAAIIRTVRDNRLPSDHFPVVAEVRFPPRTAPPVAIGTVALEPTGALKEPYRR